MIMVCDFSEKLYWINKERICKSRNTYISLINTIPFCVLQTINIIAYFKWQVFIKNALFVRFPALPCINPDFLSINNTIGGEIWGS